MLRRIKKNFVVEHDLINDQTNALIVTILLKISGLDGMCVAK